MQTELKPIVGVHRRVQWQYLHDSPTQPRPTYDEAYINELAESIKANGDILQELMLRKRMANTLRPLDTWTLEDDGYEIIFGHCRKRGGMKAGLPDGPCYEVEMTDEQVVIAQLSENLNRKDLTFLEEAEALAKMRFKLKVEVAELMKITGKSRTYVYNQLKLSQACDEVKADCRAGKLDQETATRIARVEPHSNQVKALKDTQEILRQDGDKGSRKIRRELLDKFSLQLKDAIWSADDAELVPDAGACTTCPKRSGCTPELYADVIEKQDHYYVTKQGKDLCMDPECFALKKKTTLANDARELGQDGRTVVTGNAARQALSAHGDVKGSYVALKDVKGLLKTLKGADRPQTVLIQDQRSGKTIEAIKKADLAGAGVVLSDVAEDRNRAKAEDQKQWDDKAAQEEGHRKALFMDLRTAMHSKARSKFELGTLAKAFIAELNWQTTEPLAELYDINSTPGDFEKLIDRSSPDAVAMLLMDALMVGEISVNTHALRHGYDQPTQLLAMANHHGFHVPKHRAAWEAANGLSTPPTAAQAQEGGSKKASKKSAAACAGDPSPEVCDRTLPLPLDEPSTLGQKVTDEPAPPAVATTEADRPVIWPFKGPGPSAQEVSDNAGDAGGPSDQVGATATA